MCPSTRTSYSEENEAVTLLSGFDIPTSPQFVPSQPTSSNTPLDHSLGYDMTLRPPFLSLPIELRNDIYRFFVVSRLSTPLHLAVLRPICFDDAMVKIGYFERDAVLPLMLTCRQIHNEASSVLYAENDFIINISSLAEHPIRFFELSPWYLRSVRKAYLRTKILRSPSPTPIEAFSTLPAIQGPADQSVLGETTHRSLSDSLYEIRQSNMLVRQAASAKTGFLVDCETTIDLPAAGWLWRLERDPEQLRLDESRSSSCQLWKMLVESHDTGTRQVFRRIRWTNEPAKEH